MSKQRQFLNFTRLYGSRYALPVAIITLLLAPTFYVNDLVFHSLAEILSIIGAMMIFFLSWSTDRYLSDRFFLFLATGYFWVAFMDLFHTLHFPGLGIFENDNGNTSIQSWLIARFVEALMLMSVPLMANRSWRKEHLFVFFGGITTIGLALLHSNAFPKAMDHNVRMTDFKITFELVIIGILFVSFFTNTLFRQRNDKKYFQWIIPAIALTLFSEVCFAVYASVSDFPVLLGHLLKVISVWVIWLGVWVVTLEEPFRKSLLLARAVEQSPTTVMITDADARINYVNRTFEVMTGYTREDVLGKNPRFLSSGTTPVEQYTSMWNRLVNGEVWRGMFQNKRKSGTEFVERATISSIKNSAGDIEHYIATKEDLSEIRRAEQILTKDDDTLRLTLMGAIGSILDLLEARDPYTAGHSKRVSELAVKIGEEYGLETTKLEGLRIAALIHDIGKIKIPMEILNKPGRLSAEEFALVKQHSEVGYQAIKHIPFPMDIPSIVRSHHEKWNGKGYPRGIAGDDIPVEAQILSVADVIESVMSHRPYRPSLGIEKAMQIVHEEDGQSFRSDVVVAAKKAFEAGRLSV